MDRGNVAIAARYLKRRHAPVDKTLVVILCMLLMAGLLALFSATYYKGLENGDALKEVKEQLFGAAVGFAVAYIYAFLLSGLSGALTVDWLTPAIVANTKLVSLLL